MKLTKDLFVRAVADECRNNLFYFVKTFWDVIIHEDPVYNWHIPYLCEELQKLAQPVFERKPKLYDLIVNIPPSTTKSTIVTVMFPAWLWTNDPTIRVISNSYSSALSLDHATKSKDIIQSEKYMMLFPEVEIRHDKSGKQNYENTAGGFRYASSTGSTITGFHAHIIINDDPVNPKQAESDQMRKVANDHVKTLSSRKVDKAVTPTITIMQRLHQDDVTGYLLSKKKDKIKHINLPAEDCEDVEPAELRKKKLRLGSHLLILDRSIDSRTLYYQVIVIENNIFAFSLEYLDFRRRAMALKESLGRFTFTAVAPYQYFLIIKLRNNAHAVITAFTMLSHTDDRSDQGIGSIYDLREMQAALEYFLTAGIKLDHRVILSTDALILFIDHKLDPSELTVQGVGKSKHFRQFSFRKSNNI